MMFQTPQFSTGNNQEDSYPYLQNTVNNYLNSLAAQLAPVQSQKDLPEQIHESKMYQIRVLSVHDTDSEEEDSLYQEKRSNQMRKVDECHQSRVTFEEEEGQFKGIKLMDSKKEQENYPPLTASKNKPIPFKRSHKVIKSQITKKKKGEESRYLDTSSPSKSSHKSMILPFSKTTGGYNQLRDKMLVQYFYPKQNKITQQCQDETKHQESPQSKVFKKSKSQRKHHFFKHLKKQGYETVNQCGRNVQYTDYDLISCRSSLSPYQRGHRVLQKLNIQTQRDSKGLKTSEVQLLKHRIVALESQVLGKVPYLLKMGVKFRKIRRH